MNNLTRTVMTIAVAGSLLFGGVAVSSAQLAKTIETEREQIKTLNNYLNNYRGGEPDPDPLICKARGKVASIFLGPDDGTFFSIYSMEEGKAVHFNLISDNDHRKFDLLKEAWAKDRDVVAKSIVGCFEDTEFIWGGPVHHLSVGENEIFE